MTREQEALVVAGLPLVGSIVGRLKCCLPKAVDPEELTGAGNLGLVKAALKFDPTRGVPFAVYARIRIRGEIQDQMRRDSNISRHAMARGEPEPIVLSVNEPTRYEGQTIEDSLCDHRLDSSRIVAGHDGCDKIISLFEGRDRRIFEMLHVDGHNMMITAAILGISEARIHIINKGLRAKVREYLDGEALDAAS